LAEKGGIRAESDERKASRSKPEDQTLRRHSPEASVGFVPARDGRMSIAACLNTPTTAID